MRLTYSIFCAALLLTSSREAPSVEIENFSLISEFIAGFGTSSWGSMQGQLELMPALDMVLSENLTLVFSARVRADYEDELEPGRPPRQTYAAITEPLIIGDSGTAELRDTYLEYRGGNGLIRLGKQQIVWGRLDGIKVLDMINPQDFREFIIDEFEDSRISQWGAYFDYTLGDWRAEVAFVPDSSGHAIPRTGAWFELSAPRFRYGSKMPQSSLPVRTQQPGLSIDETGIGLRLTRSTNLFELSVVGYSGMDPEPLGRLVGNRGGVFLERFYERRDALGFSLDMGLGPAVIRLEYAYQPDRSFNTRRGLNLDEIELNQHRGAIGFDLDGPLGIFFNFQYLIDHVSDAPDALVRPDQDQIATFFMRRTFFYDTLTAEARWYQSFSEGDHMALFSIDYAFSESVSMGAAFQTFDGTRKGLFGQFEGRDRLTFSLRHTF